MYFNCLYKIFKEIFIPISKTITENTINGFIDYFVLIILVGCFVICEECIYWHNTKNIVLF